MYFIYYILDTTKKHHTIDVKRNNSLINDILNLKIIKH